MKLKMEWTRWKEQKWHGRDQSMAGLKRWMRRKCYERHEEEEEKSWAGRRRRMVEQGISSQIGIENPRTGGGVDLVRMDYRGNADPLLGKKKVNI